MAGSIPADMPATALPLFHTMHAALRSGRGALDELFPDPVATQVRRARAAGWNPDTPNLYCSRCGATTGPGAQTASGCAFCAGTRLPWDRVVRLAPYRPPVSHWIVAMKFAAVWSWGDWFGTQLAHAVERSTGTAVASLEATPPACRRLYSPPHAAGSLPVNLPASLRHRRQFVASRGILVCPTPMPWRRRWRRGYNQAHLMALAFGKTRNWRVAPLLYRSRYTPPQTAIPPSARPANVRRSFGIRRVDLTGYDIWLIDDVKTTGSTLKQCARLLRRHGARSINIAVAAVADPRRQDFQTI
jgi:predicted amidophosphoribosyltransferase